MADITGKDKHFLEEMKKQLATLGSKESNFLRVELLFYDALQLARNYGSNLQENKLLADLKQLQSTGYADAKSKCKKVSAQERIIKRFIVQFKLVLKNALKKNYA